jgi:adenylosuccinate synthase
MNIVVIGAQWGDEGKGKIVDFLAEDAALIVRFSGGANAGHTIVLGSEQYALHLIPSGVLYPGKIVVLGAAMVIDPNALFDEIAMLEARGIAPAGRIFISDRAHIVLPSAIALDKARDAARKQPLGTTGRGIGTSYAMKSERVGVRLADLDRLEMLAELSDEDRAFLEQHRERLLAMSIDLAAFLAQAVSASPSGMKRATVTQGGVAGPPEAVSAFASSEKAFANEIGSAHF